MRSNKGRIEIVEISDPQGERLLTRCLVGSVEQDCKEKPTLPDIRKWSNLAWKNTLGVNIYEMYDENFLFEFPNKHMAEQVLKGQWSWRNMRFNLVRWSPMVGFTSSSIIKKVKWIRAIGVPLYPWSHEVSMKLAKSVGVG